MCEEGSSLCGFIQLMVGPCTFNHIAHLQMCHTQDISGLLIII
jgi:hypothetical protein